MRRGLQSNILNQTSRVGKHVVQDTRQSKLGKQGNLNLFCTVSKRQRHQSNTVGKAIASDSLLQTTAEMSTESENNNFVDEVVDHSVSMSSSTKTTESNLDTPASISAACEVSPKDVGCSNTFKESPKSGKKGKD